MSENGEREPGGEPIDTTDEVARRPEDKGMNPREGSGRTDPAQPPGRDDEEPPRDKS
jgi:hypothetical protein